MTAAIRTLLRSKARSVLIEAPAGCGKTYEAASLAMDTVPDLNTGQKVLLLAHTNAAKEEFTRRTKSAGRRIEVGTIDSLCNRVLGPYAPAVGLPSPLDRHIGNRGERVPYPTLALRTADLFGRSPTVARLLGKKYPLIIGDEHQDADANQHAVLAKMAEAGGSRLRLFGDPMQAIFERENRVPWEKLRDEADDFADLDAPKRWRQTQESRQLGDWIIAARQELRTGRPLPLAYAPESVSIIRCRWTDRDAHVQENAGLISGMIHRFISDAGQGNPRRAAKIVLDLVKESSVGVSQADYDRLSRMFEIGTLVNVPRGRLEPLAAVFRPIYDDVTLVGLFRECRLVCGVGMQRFRLRKRVCLRLLAALTKRDGEVARDELAAVIAARKAVSAKPTRAASTIHKAKGLEFDHVLVAYCGASHFPDNDAQRRLLYVAISHAANRLVLHVPENSPSPLIGNG